MSEENATPAAAAAAAASNEDENGVSSRTVAETLQAVEQLTSVFGFDWEVANQAVNEVGTDITQAYNYILDQGLGQDQGGPIVPITDCPHVKSHVLLNPQRLPSAHSRCNHYEETRSDSAAAVPKKGGAKDVVEEDGTCPAGENWVCLQCGAVRCSRYINGHGLVHWEETKVADNEQGVGHCIAASLADLSVWCHECSAYLRHPNLDPLIQKLEQLKFDTPTTEETEAKEDPTYNINEANHEEDIGRGVPLDLPDSHVEEQHDEDSSYFAFDRLPTNLKEVADFIQSDRCRSILVLAGAGMSVTSGIPDFRSSGGFYETLRPELLTASAEEREAIRSDPTAALTQTLFLQNQLPCLELKRPFLLGTRDAKWKATLAHRFVELLHSKTGKLTRLYTQNIDGLEGQCHKLPRDKVIPVHGSMDRAECAFCGETTDFDEFCNDVKRQIKDITGQDPTAPTDSSNICCETCGHATLKPSIVLFRSSLPEVFFRTVQQDLPDVDLLIVVGTSLTVAPANTLVFRVPPSALRLVVNRDKVGRRLGVQYDEDAERDYFAQGDCDAVLLDLMTELGWLGDLEPLMNDLPEESAKLLQEKLESHTPTTTIG